jgi:hypothetical protein
MHVKYITEVYKYYILYKNILFIKNELKESKLPVSNKICLFVLSSRNIKSAPSLALCKAGIQWTA